MLVWGMVLSDGAQSFRLRYVSSFGFVALGFGKASLFSAWRLGLRLGSKGALSARSRV